MKKISCLLLSFLCTTVFAMDLVVVNDGQQRVLTYDDIANIAPSTLTTHTPWDDGPSEFTGVLFEDFIKHVKIETDEVLAKALGDYQVVMPVADVIAAGGFVAITRDGKPMPVRSKGPYWIIFPYEELNMDTAPSTLVRSWSIWNLTQIESFAR